MRVTLFGAAFDPPHVGHVAIAVSLLRQNLTDEVWLLPVKEHAFGKKLAPERDRLTMVEMLREEVVTKLGNLHQIDSAKRKSDNNELNEMLNEMQILNQVQDSSPHAVDSSVQHDRVRVVQHDGKVKIQDDGQLIKVERYELEQSGVSYTYLTLQALSRLYPEHQFSFVIGSDNLARFHEWPHYLDMPKQFPFFVYPREGFPLKPLYLGMLVMKDVQPIVVSSTQVREKIRSGKAITELVPESISEYIQEVGLYR